MYKDTNMDYPYTHPIRDLASHSRVKRPPEMKGCAVCSVEFIKRENADTFELRQLCNACIKVWKAREGSQEGYRKDA